MRFKKSQSGFTLIEIVASLALLGIIAAAFLSIISFGIDGVFTMGRKSVASEVAEKCINAYYEVADSDTTAGHYDNSNTTQNSAVAAKINTIRSENPLYSITNTVTGPSAENLYTVTVVVTYRHSTRSVTLNAIIP